MIRLLLLSLLFLGANSTCEWEFLQDITSVANVTKTSKVRLEFSPSGEYLGVWNEEDNKVRVFRNISSTWIQQFLETVTSRTGSMVLANDGTIVTDENAWAVVSHYDQTMGYWYSRFVPKQGEATFSVSSDGMILAVGSELYNLSNKTWFPRHFPMLPPDVTEAIAPNKTVTYLSGNGEKFFSVVNDNPSARAVVQAHCYQSVGQKRAWIKCSQLEVPSYLADVRRIRTSQTAALVVLQSSDNKIALFRQHETDSTWRWLDHDFDAAGIVASQVQLANSILLTQTATGLPALYRVVGDFLELQKETNVGVTQSLAMTTNDNVVALASSQQDDLSIRIYRLGCPAVPPEPPSPLLPLGSPPRAPSQELTVTATVFDLEWSISFHDKNSHLLSEVHRRRWKSATEQEMEVYYQNQRSESTGVKDFRTAMTIRDQRMNEQGDLILRYDQKVTYTIVAASPQTIVYPPSHYCLLPMTDKHEQEVLPQQWKRAIPTFETIVIPLVTQPYLTETSRTEYLDPSNSAQSVDPGRKGGSRTFLIVILVLVSVIVFPTAAVLVWCFWGMGSANKSRTAEEPDTTETTATPAATATTRDEALPGFKNQVMTLPLARAIPMGSSDSSFPQEGGSGTECSPLPLCTQHSDPAVSLSLSESASPSPPIESTSAPPQQDTEMTDDSSTPRSANNLPQSPDLAPTTGRRKESVPKPSRLRSDDEPYQLPSVLRQTLWAEQGSFTAKTL